VPTTTRFESLRLAAIPAILLTSFATAADESGVGRLTRAPYVQMGASDSMTIVWRTEGRIEPVVHFGRQPDALEQRTDSRSVVVRVSPDCADPELPRLHSAPPGTYQYEARLSGLGSDVTYYYAIYDGDRRLAGGDETYRFMTHPKRGESRPFRFWVVGDSGTGGSDQARVHQAMLDWTRHEDRPLDLYLHVGDMAYGDGTDDQFQHRFFEMYEPTLRNVVCWPAMGNHEGHTSKGETGIGPYYDAYVVPTRAEAGGLASGTEAYYSFDYGTVHFVCLDSHDLDRRPSGAMAQWLKADLEKTRAEWLIAFWHHPPYTKGSHDSDREEQLIEMREHIMPILESAGVDLVLTGHSHIYERSMLMDGAYATPTIAEGVILDDGDGDPEGDGAYRKSRGLHPHEGTIQIVAGHGGAGLRRKGTMPVMKRVIVEHGSVLVDVDGDTLVAIMVDKHGAKRDLFSMVKRGQVTPQRISNPRQLPPYDPPVTTEGRPPLAKLPDGAVELIAPADQWDYLAGSHPEGSWTEFSYVGEGWKTGRAGFGYGDDDDMTVLRDMEGKYTAVYIRCDFPEITQPEGELGLVINYDDAFIAYINGHEVLRVGIEQGRGPDVEDIDGHEARGYSYFPLKDFRKYLRPDENMLSIEGHNDGLGSSDFTLDPYLVFIEKK
jgi:acid phosphatase type 7